VTGEELARRIEDGSVVVIDVRSSEEYDGVAGYPCDPVQGHIPGAIHLDWQELFGSAGALGRDEVVALLAERDVDSTADIVTYCHSGQRSAMAAAALRGAGLVAENYEGSWHEWSRRPSS
jgi:thiosulfate/3-mercaptopyruvate sulfurtransferase